MDDVFEQRLTDRLRADAERGVSSFDSKAIVAIAMSAAGSTGRFASPLADFPLLGRVSRMAVAAVAIAVVVVLAVSFMPRRAETGPSGAPLQSEHVSPKPSPSPPASPTPSPLVPVSSEPSLAVQYSNWTQVALRAPDDKTTAMSVTGVVQFKGEYFAVGSQQLAGDEARLLVWRSADGAEWQPIPIDVPFSAIELWDVASDDEEIVVSGYTTGPTDDRMRYSVLTSPDGQAWTRQDAPDLFTSLTERDGLFVASTPNATDAAQPTSIWTSTDGTDWSMVADREELQDPPSDVLTIRRLQSVEVDGEPAVIAAGWNDAGATLWISTDAAAEEWASIDLANPGNVTLADVAAGPRGMLAVGTEGYCCRMRAWTSSNGTDWAAVSEPLDEAMFASSAVALEDGFLVIGGRPTSDASIPAAWFTRDGRSTWQEIPIADALPTESNVQNFDLATAPDGSTIAVATEFSDTGLPLTPLAWLLER